jgi:hypothetical protein
MQITLSDSVDEANRNLGRVADESGVLSRNHTRSPEPWINSQLRANDARRAGLASPPPIAAIRCGSAI